MFIQYMFEFDVSMFESITTFKVVASTAQQRPLTDSNLLNQDRTKPAATTNHQKLMDAVANEKNQRTNMKNYNKLWVLH